MRYKDEVLAEIHKLTDDQTELLENLKIPDRRRLPFILRKERIDELQRKYIGTDLFRALRPTKP